jgi:type II secretory pathway component PulF
MRYRYQLRQTSGRILRGSLVARDELTEPVLISALGLVVLLVFMAIIQPMLTMNSFAF